MTGDGLTDSTSEVHSVRLSQRNGYLLFEESKIKGVCSLTCPNSRNEWGWVGQGQAEALPS